MLLQQQACHGGRPEVYRITIKFTDEMFHWNILDVHNIYDRKKTREIGRDRDKLIK